MKRLIERLGAPWPNSRHPIDFAGLSRRAFAQPIASGEARRRGVCAFKRLLDAVAARHA